MIKSIVVIIMLFTGLVCVACARSTGAKSSSSTVEQYQKLCKSMKINSCTVESLEVDFLSEKLLIDKLESSFDKRHNVLIHQYYHYFVSIAFKKKPTGNSTQTAAFVGNILDRFFGQRPWWIVRKYPYEPHENESEQNVMILERVPALIEASSRAIIAANSPSLEGCKTRTKNIKIGLGTWGNDLAVNYPHFFDSYPDFIKMIYETRTGSINDHVGFVEPQSCPNDIDKYTCVFLPISNCTLPDTLFTCHEQACMKEGLYSPTTGKRIVPEPEEQKFNHKTAFYPDSFSLAKQYNYEYANYRAMRLKDSLAPVVPGNIEFIERNDLWGELHQYNYVFNLLNRFNYRLGVKVQDFVNREIFGGTKVGQLINLAAVLSKQQSSPTTDKQTVTATTPPPLAGVVMNNDINATYCVAAHIRMGDDHYENASMLTWCREHTRPGATGDDRAMGLWDKDGTNLTIQQWHDMGCNTRLPFRSLSLMKVINASRLVSPTAREILIMTDDHRWLRRELNSLSQQQAAAAAAAAAAATTDSTWPLLRVIPNHINDRRNRMSLQATVEWWATIMTARRCGAFVGHLHSTATMAIYRAMCFEHEGKYMTCPKLFQFD